MVVPGPEPVAAPVKPPVGAGAARTCLGLAAASFVVTLLGPSRTALLVILGLIVAGGVVGLTVTRRRRVTASPEVGLGPDNALLGVTLLVYLAVVSSLTVDRGWVSLGVAPLAALVVATPLMVTAWRRR